MNCSGWNEGSMKVNSCVVDFSPLRTYANYYYGFIVISAFLGFLPIIVYIVIGSLLSNSIATILSRIFDKHIDRELVKMHNGKYRYKNQQAQ